MLGLQLSPRHRQPWPLGTSGSFNILELLWSFLARSFLTDFWKLSGSFLIALLQLPSTFLAAFLPIFIFFPGILRSDTFPYFFFNQRKNNFKLVKNISVHSESSSQLVFWFWDPNLFYLKLIIQLIFFSRFPGGVVKEWGKFSIVKEDLLKKFSRSFLQLFQNFRVHV